MVKLLFFEKILLNCPEVLMKAKCRVHQSKEVVEVACFGISIVSDASHQNDLSAQEVYQFCTGHVLMLLHPMPCLLVTHQ